MSSILHRFELSSIKRMLKNAKAVAEYSNRSILSILFDMSRCILKDHVGYMEYNLFNFANKTKKQRDTYVTFDYSQYLFKSLNDMEYRDIFSDKLKFNKIFYEYLNRDYLDVCNSDFKQFKQFCQSKTKVFAKPADSCSGKGIYRLFDIDNDNLEQLYQYFKENKLFIEDPIVQHYKMNLLNETSINTVRITTLLHNDEVHIMYALLRIGRSGMSVDNVGSGGIYTVVSDDGKIINPCWSDKTISTYTKHPDSGFELIGFEIPYFKQALELCKKAAKVEKHIRYVGWDVAIGENGPMIVEGNPLPGYDMPQNYFVTNRDCGLKPEFEKILKG